MNQSENDRSALLLFQLGPEARLGGTAALGQK
jgi:hypothetical protein